MELAQSLDLVEIGKLIGSLGGTTLLGIASGFVDPDLGRVRIGGEPLRRDSPAEARTLGLAMAFGRFLPIIMVLALAGSFAAQGKTPESVGTLPTHRPQFVGMVVGVTLILVALTFLPMLALGPLAEGIH